MVQRLCWTFNLILFLAAITFPYVVLGRHQGIERIKCKSREGLPFRPHSDQRHRISAVRDQMRLRSSSRGYEINAYIITSFDEHLNEDVNDHDKRRQYISGFTGPSADVAITLNSSALWTDEQYLAQANSELNCDWQIFSRSGNGPNMIEWLAAELPYNTKIGVDPRTVPHYLWEEWDAILVKSHKFIHLVRIYHNLIDLVWTKRPPPIRNPITVHPLVYAGKKWQDKVYTLRDHLLAERCDAIIVSSLTEIAYLLNLRGNDLPHTPVFKAYLLVEHRHINLYVDKAKVDLGITNHLQPDPREMDYFVNIRPYHAIWQDLQTYSQIWRSVLVPSRFVFDLGSSEAIYNNINRDIIVEKPSPIILMRAHKNEVERQGMHRAHVLDGAAMCEALSKLERRSENKETVTEMSAAKDVDLARYEIISNQRLAFNTIVAFGPHGSLPHFQTLSDMDMLIFDNSTVIIESGGQYNEGTTKVTRTVHYGEPSVEQKRAYTNILRAIIRLSTFKFPENLKAADVDALARSSVWGSLIDYPQPTGHGIGSFLSVIESPINLSYLANDSFRFQDGYFFSTGLSYYKPHEYGVRLENVLEVYDTGKRHPMGAKFLGFRDVSLVPYERNLIDNSLLNAQEKRWLNDYNAKIRNLVGDELKKQVNAQAFHWMMNKTKHFLEYLPESEYRKTNRSHYLRMSHYLLVILAINVLMHFI